MNRSAVATIKGWKSGSHISGLDPEEMEFAVDLMNNSIPGCMCLQYSNFESPELEKIERSCKMLVFILKEGDSYIEVCSNKIKIITMGHNENANELVKFPTLKLSSLDETSKLVIKMHKVSFRGNNLLASDLFEDCIEELRITDILRFKLDESAAEAEQTIYIPQALESTDDARTKYPSTTALVNDIIISRALRHLIVGDAGTGKTQTLLSLEKQFGESLPNYWILLKDLSQCNKLPDLAGDSDNIESVDALRLLFEDVLLQLDPSQRRVLESKVQSGKVVFLLDSFDAVWSRKVNTVRRLINSVCEKGIQVMSTRTYRASDLKGYKTYQIGALDEAELVSQQWIRNKVTKPHSEVRALLKALDPNVTSVPLHLVLSAEYFADHATTQLNLVELFREHIEVALADQHLVRGLLHKLSAYHLFEGENCEKPSDTELDMLRGCRLVKIVGSDAEFKHRPVCEFLFATATMRRMFKQPKPHEDKFKQILLSPERALLRHFMDQMDDEGSTWPKCFQPLEKCTLMAVCLREKLFNLMRILCQGDSVLPDVVQMLVRSDSLVEPENFSQFFAQLEENGKMSKEDKNIALDLAFYAENVELVRVLLDRGADPGVRNSINKVSFLRELGF